MSKARCWVGVTKIEFEHGMVTVERTYVDLGHEPFTVTRRYTRPSKHSLRRLRRTLNDFVKNKTARLLVDESGNWIAKPSEVSPIARHRPPPGYPNEPPDEPPDRRRRPPRRPQPGPPHGTHVSPNSEEKIIVAREHPFDPNHQEDRP